MARVAGTTSASAAPVCPVDVFTHCLELTRRSLCNRLADAPAGDVVAPYFERGKMLRASLVFAAAAAVGAAPEDVIPAAEAIELLHGASLFHDDIIDQAAHRRGFPSLHARIGTGPALVAGDDLLLRAMAVLGEARTRHAAARVADASDLLNRLARECCRGQLDELLAPRWISEAEYLDIVSRKTAAPFVAAGVLGVVLGGGTDAQATCIRSYARHLGIAFQIADDLLDLVGEAAALGKPVGNSLAHNRPILPLIRLWHSSSDTARRRLERLARNPAARPELVALLDRHGVLDGIRHTQQRYVDTALDALASFEPSPGVESLRGLAMRAFAGPTVVAADLAPRARSASSGSRA